MSTAVVVILAGGRGERLGGTIKADIVLGAERLLDRVARTLAGTAPILVALGPHRGLALSPGMIGLPDLDTDYRGPLAGLAAAVDWALQQERPPEALVVAAVDTPFLPDEYAARLRSTLGRSPAIVCHWGEQDFPTHAAWRLEAVAGLPDALRDGTAPRSLRRLAATIGAAQLDWMPGAVANPFDGINTPEELVAARLRAGETPVQVSRN